MHPRPGLRSPGTGAKMAAAVARLLVFIRGLGWPVAAAVVAACAAQGTPPAATLAPDLGRRLVAEHGVVTSAHPLASEAGVAMLRQGGNAVDAAVATAFAIGVVEPEMSGVGGGGAMLIWRQRERQTDFADFYSAQPVAAFRQARATRPDTTAPLRIVGIPGNVGGLLEAHEKFGRLPRATVMAPAIRLADEGFPLYQVLAEMIDRDSVRLRRDPVAAEHFWPDGRARTPGDIVRNPPLAAVLRRIAADGRKGFYEGETARAVVERLNRGGHPATLADLAAYQVVWRRPLCTTYRGRVVLSAPPPQGGVQVLQSLKLLERYDLRALGLPTRSAPAFDVFTSAMRAGQQVARTNDDPRWVAIPARGLVSDGFAAAWRGDVGNGHPADTLPWRDARPFDGSAASAPEACRTFAPYEGSAAVAPESAPADAPAPTTGETTHIAVVDASGDAVSVTVTNSSMFGSGVAVSGFLLNDSGIRAFRQEDLDRPNGPAWRTRTSTIAPTIVLDGGGAVKMVVGSPGAGRIPLAMLQTMSYVLDYGLDPLEALRMPRIYPSRVGRTVELEGGFEPDLLAQARAMGYFPTAQAFGYARLYMIVRDGNRWIGAADPRHDGQVRGY
jgi:gamma-glutamyltranspeptidase / glutathione hydrolase